MRLDIQNVIKKSLNSKSSFYTLDTYFLLILINKYDDESLICVKINFFCKCLDRVKTTKLSIFRRLPLAWFRLNLPLKNFHTLLNFIHFYQ